ncbi:glutathione S-transferase N-terminal domain-containing protein [Acetobacteraceae bacterium H6797]|nr:glutathione S-transferase N-terminal domain-containing protein [Acetobacteraceae bacterium H6797]
MTKLYYSPGSCALGIHIILEEIGKPYELALVNTRENEQNQPAYLAINPKAKVPALDIGAGKVLTQWPAIAQYLAMSHPEAKLWPTGLVESARCAEAVDYICGSVHPMGFTRQYRAGNFAANEADQPRVIAQAKEFATKAFEILDAQWGEKPWFLETGYSVADAALFFVTYWATRRSGMTLPPKLARHLDAMLARPAVQRMLAQEKLAA